jgi:hypothetical protein
MMVAIALGFAMIPAAPAQTVPASLQAEIAELVQQLGSRDYKEREKANKALNAIGPKSLGALKAALLASESPEVQRRLEVMIDKFRMELLTAPTRVSVSAKNQQVKLVLKDICKQAGYNLSEGIGPELKVTLELKDAPFWEVLEKVTAGTGIITSFQEDERHTLNAYMSNQVNPYVDCGGPFRFIASNINTNRNLQLANMPLRGNQMHHQSEYLSLNVQFHAEPKCPVVSVGTAIATKAVDDLGGSLVMPKVEGQNLPEVRFYQNGMYRSLNQSVSMNLTRGDRRATTIKELTGKVNLLLLSEIRPEVEIEKVLEPGKKKVAGQNVEFELGELTEANGGYSAKVTFRQRNPNPNDYGWWGNIYQRLELHDEKGGKFQTNGMQEQNVGVGVVSMKIEFMAPEAKKLGKPFKLVLVEWVTVEKAFEFSFKEIPLP